MELLTNFLAATDSRRKRTFKAFSYRGVDLKDLLELPTEEFAKLAHARVRRRFQRGLNNKPYGLIKN